LDRLFRSSRPSRGRLPHHPRV